MKRTTTLQRSSAQIIFSSFCIAMLIWFLYSTSALAQTRRYTDTELWNITVKEYNKANKAEAEGRLYDAYLAWNSTLSHIDEYKIRNPARMRNEASHRDQVYAIYNTALAKITAVNIISGSSYSLANGTGSTTTTTTTGTECPGGVESQTAEDCPGVRSQEALNALLEIETPQSIAELMPLYDIDCVSTNEFTTITEIYIPEDAYFTGDLMPSDYLGNLILPDLSFNEMPQIFSSPLATSFQPCIVDGVISYP